MHTCPTCDLPTQGLLSPPGYEHRHCRYCGTQITIVYETRSGGWEMEEYVTVPELHRQRENKDGIDQTEVQA